MVNLMEMPTLSLLQLLAWLGIVTIWWFSFMIIIQEVSKWSQTKKDINDKHPTT